MDDFGNELHWTYLAIGLRSLGLYGWADGAGNGVMDAVDFSEVLND